VAELVA